MTERRPQPKHERAAKGDYEISDIPGGWRITGTAGDARGWAQAVLGVREKRSAAPARVAAKRRMMLKALEAKQRRLARKL